jgi:hypothetical protein
MKSIIIPAIMLASLLLTGCGKMGDDLVERTKTGVATGKVVGYARTGRSTTNILLTVTEIWKGSGQSSRFGIITNGMQFPLEWSRWNDNEPEAAIFVFSEDTNLQTTHESFIWVRSGQVEHMTVQEFKSKIGL